MGKTVGIYFGDELLESVRTHAKANAKGLSPYVNEILACHVSRTPNPLPKTRDEKPLEQLVAAYSPALVPDIEGWCEESSISERQFVSKLIYHLATTAGERALTPQQFLRQIELIDSEEIDRLEKAIAARKERHLKAAEGKEPYTGKQKSRPKKAG